MRRLRNYLDGLPDEARCRREDPDEPRWGVLEELIAQVVEEVSVLAAERRRPEPRKIPRPGVEKAEAKQRAATHGGLLTAAMGRARRG